MSGKTGNKILRSNNKLFQFNDISFYNEGMILSELCNNIVFYDHGTVHISNTDHINANEMQLFLCFLFRVKSSTCFGRPLRPSSGTL